MLLSTPDRYALDSKITTDMVRAYIVGCMKLRYHVMTETAPTESFDTKDEALAYIRNQVGPVTLDPSEIEDNEHAKYMWVYRSATNEKFVIGWAI